MAARYPTVPEDSGLSDDSGNSTETSGNPVPRTGPDKGAGLSAVPSDDLSKLADEQLMARAVHDDASFRELVSRYERPTYLMAFGMLGSRHDAEEVSQEAFLAIYKNARLFDPERSFTAWFYTIAGNLCKNVLRARKRKFLSLDYDCAQEPEEREDSNPANILQEQSTRNDIAQAVSSLKPKYSVVLMLRYGEGCSYEEIGEQLGLTLSAVDTRLYRAKKLLRSKLESMGIKNYPF